MNIACERRTSLNEILDKLRDLLGVDVQAQYAHERPGDVKHSLADISRARETIGYQPEVYFEQGLERAIDWYRENLA
jgi:nucleoside-diphosphate-sugar epimerase